MSIITTKLQRNRHINRSYDFIVNNKEPKMCLLSSQIVLCPSFCKTINISLYFLHFYALLQRNPFS